MATKLVRNLLLDVVLVTAVSYGCNKSDRSFTAPTGPVDLPPPPPAPTASGLTGSYLLTLTASASCSTVSDPATRKVLPLPDYVQVRRYYAEFANGKASLTPIDGTEPQVSIGGIDYYIYWGVPLMTASETELTIIVPGNTAGATCAGGDYWWEFLDEADSQKEGFELCGIWRGSMEDSARIDGTINGAFMYHKRVGSHWSLAGYCSAQDHLPDPARQRGWHYALV